MDETITAGFIGCGSHARRNVFPALQFAPVRLTATCDIDIARAEECARQFGAQRAYAGHEEMLEHEDLDAVFIVTDYDEHGRPKYPPLAIDCMRAACHVWIEKPPAASVAEIEDMQRASEATGKFVLVGFKKCFAPAVRRAREIMQREEFGSLTSLYVRYPQRLPSDRDKREGGKRLRGFLDHIAHPGSIVQHLAGPISTVIHQRTGDDEGGGGFALLRLASGAVGTMHFSAHQSGTSPLERVEAIGHGANVVIDNGIKLTYYRPGRRGPGGYGRATSYMGDDDTAPIYWEPEFSLGQLYNKGLFLLGYAQEVAYFAECVLADERPTMCGLEDALEVTKLYEALLRPEGEIVPL
ncbi:MAG: Gfo/Idh/MocA family oxidoreductase [Armatimonadota bacterium]|jgi:predicted dehydrogenase